MKSSAHTVPAGLDLYRFEYESFAADAAPNPDEPESIHLESDDEARFWANQFGACKAVHAATGRVVWP